MFLAMGKPDDDRLQAMCVAFLPWVRDRIKRGRYSGWFAVEGGEVIAGLGMMLLDWPPHVLHLEPNRACIFNVFTEPPYRRKGIARRLIETALDEAKRRGLTIVTLHASEDGRPLYARLGFVPTNEMQLVNLPLEE